MVNTTAVILNHIESGEAVKAASQTEADIRSPHRIEADVLLHT
jgi:hypothetical protein